MPQYFLVRLGMIKPARLFVIPFTVCLMVSTGAASNDGLPNQLQQSPQTIPNDSAHHVTGAKTDPGRPRTALFHENQKSVRDLQQGRMSWGWLAAGLYVLSGLLFGGLSGYRALSKGLAPMPYFLLGFFLSILGYLFVLTRPAALASQVPPGLVKVPATYAPVPCGRCGHPNHPAAKQCAGCGGGLQPLVQSDLDRLA